MRTMTHRMTSIKLPSSGLMRLRVDFDVGTNPNTDQILTQMRYLQAEASFLPMCVTSVSPSSSRQAARWRLVSLSRRREPIHGTFLANHAYININDPMSRVPGVGQR